MSENSVLSLSEGAQRAGVSLATLEQYIDFGFINPVEQGGDRFVKQVDLDNLFGARPEETQEEKVEKEEEVGEPATDEPPLSAKVEVEKLDEVEVEPELIEDEAEEKSAEFDGSYELIAMTRRLKEEIRQLREERDWLRERLERLESRAERDQMLLMSESETVRRLVQTGNPRRGFWSSFLLPWSKND